MADKKTEAKRPDLTEEEVKTRKIQINLPEDRWAAWDALKAKAEAGLEGLEVKDSQLLHMIVAKALKQVELPKAAK